MRGHLAFEWRRFATLRSSWLIVAAALLLSIVISGLLAWAAEQNRDMGPRGTWALLMTQGASQGSPLAAGFVIALLGAFAWHEDVTGDNVSTTLTTYPSRTGVACCRYVAIGVVSLVTATLCSLAAALTSTAVLGWSYARPPDRNIGRICAPAVADALDCRYSAQNRAVPTGADE